MAMRRSPNKDFVQKVAEHYGTSFSDTVRVYAEQGCSKTLTASTLGMSRRYFRLLCDRFNLNGYFKPQRKMRADCKGDGSNPRKKTYSDRELLAEVAKARTLQQFKDSAKIAHTTIYYRFGSWSEAKKLSSELF